LIPPQDNGTGNAPTALRIQLGARLRQLREAKNISREAAGYEIRGSESKISRMELGRVSFKERDIADLLTLYGVRGAARDDLIALARRASSPGWWQQFGDVLAPWFANYLGLEEAASLLRTYEVQFVPGLLQTADYAREVVRLLYKGATVEEIERRVQLRLGRQRILQRSQPPQFWAVMDEAVLHRGMGGAEVMRGQLRALIELAQRPNIRLQIVSFRTGGHAAAGGPFSILRFPEPDLADMVYVEQLTSALYLDKRADVETYTIAMTQLSVEAEPPDETPAILEKVLQEIESDG
jgi:transcriptional regulator with XRE-family HTH domain